MSNLGGFNELITGMAQRFIFFNEYLAGKKIMYIFAIDN